MLKHGLIIRHSKHHLLKGLVLIVLRVILVEGYSELACKGEHLYLNSQWCQRSYGTCKWESTGQNDKISIRRKSSPSSGYALLSTTIPGEGTDSLYSVYFINYVRTLELFVGDQKQSIDLTNRKVTFTYRDSTPDTLTFTLNASCRYLGKSSYIRNLSLTVSDAHAVSPPITTPTEGTPTPIGDIQYVGVVVGAICIALFTLFSCLTIISARRSTSRESRRREIQNPCNEQDDRPDIVADNAPPSYDAVMACPDMYPATPQGTPPGTPDATPHLSLHRRVLLNQLGSSLPDTGLNVTQSQRNSLDPSVAEAWNEEQDPPPPYPGLARAPSSGEETNVSSEDTNGPNEDGSASDAGGRNPELDSTESNPRASQNNLSPDTPNNGPWVLNNTRNNPRNLRQSETGERNSQELLPRTTRLQNNDYQTSPRVSAERIDDIENELQLNNARNRRGNTPKTGNSVSTIPQLTVV